MLEFLRKTLIEGWIVVGDMAPYLLLGFLVAGILSVLISARLVERHLGSSGFGAIFKASLFGVPLPLCSCGVIPVAASLRQHGASRPATASFLLSTPQTGVDSILVTYGLLGPVFAIYRTLVALLTGFIGGILQATLDKESPSTGEPKTQHLIPDNQNADAPQGNAIYRILHYGFVSLPRSIGGHMLLGIVIAGIISSAVPKDFFAGSLGEGLVPMLVMLAIGIPLYVCATGSVPIALGLIHMGISPGAALVFLISGPATNAATLTTIWKILGKRGTFIFLGTVVFSALASGYLLDFLMTSSSISGGIGHNHAHDHGAEVPTGWFTLLNSIVLLVVLGAGILHSLLKRFQPAPITAEGDDSVKLAVNGMSCSHCVSRVEEALQSCEGVKTVSVQLKPGEAVVSGRNLNQNTLKAVVRDLGFEAELQAQ